MPKQTFRKSYISQFFYITECTKFEKTKNQHCAYCTLCNSEIFIGSGGAYDIKAHAKGRKHSEFEAGHRNNARFNSLQEKRKINVDQEEENKLADDTIKAQVLMCEVIVELDYTLIFYMSINAYCKTGYFRGHVIFAVFVVDRQSAKINDRDFKKSEKSKKVSSF